MFEVGFASIPAARIAASIMDEGYFFRPAAVEAGHVRKIRDEVGPDRIAINHNGLATVGMGPQFFLNQVLGRSKAAYDLITSDAILDIAEAALGPQFRLVNKRYYTTGDGMRMQWHRDNKSPFDRVEPRRGLLCMLYLTDVEHGAFQFVRGSHGDEPEREDPDFADDHVARRYGGRVETLPGPAGSLVFCRLETIHRAAPMPAGAAARSTLLIQIDAEPTMAEAVLINTSFVDRLDDRRRYFLGFGKREIKPDFPRTDLTTLDAASAETVFAQVAAHRRGVAGRPVACAAAADDPARNRPEDLCPEGRRLGRAWKLLQMLPAGLRRKPRRP